MFIKTGFPVIVFSSYILEGCLMLHLLMFSSCIAYTGLYLVVLLYAGLFSVEVLDGRPRLACVQ